MLVADKEMATPKSSLHAFLQSSFKDVLIFNQKDWSTSLNTSVHGRNLIYWTWFATDGDRDSIKMLKEHLHYIVNFPFLASTGLDVRFQEKKVSVTFKFIFRLS